MESPKIPKLETEAYDSSRIGTERVLDRQDYILHMGKPLTKDVWLKIQPIHQTPSRTSAKSVSRAAFEPPLENGAWWSVIHEPKPSSCPAQHKSVGFDLDMLSESVHYRENTRVPEFLMKPQSAVVLEASHITDAMKLMNRPGMIENRFDVLMAELKPDGKTESSIEFGQWPLSKKDYHINDLQNCNPLRGEAYDEEYEEDDGDTDDDDEADYSDGNDETEGSQDSEEAETDDFYSNAPGHPQRSIGPQADAESGDRIPQITLLQATNESLPIFATRDFGGSWVDIRGPPFRDMLMNRDPRSRLMVNPVRGTVAVQPLFLENRAPPRLTPLSANRNQHFGIAEDWSVINITRNNSGVSEVMPIASAPRSQFHISLPLATAPGDSPPVEEASEEAVGAPSPQFSIRADPSRHVGLVNLRNMAANNLAEISLRAPLRSLSPNLSRNHTPGGFYSRTAFFQAGLGQSICRYVRHVGFFKPPLAYDHLGLMLPPPWQPKTRNRSSQTPLTYSVRLESIGSRDCTDITPAFIDAVPSVRWSFVSNPNRRYQSTRIEHRPTANRPYRPLVSSKCGSVEQLCLRVNGLSTSSKFAVIQLSGCVWEIGSTILCVTKDNKPCFLKLHRGDTEDFELNGRFGVINLATRLLSITWRQGWSLRYLMLNKAPLGPVESATLVDRRVFNLPGSKLLMLSVYNLVTLEQEVDHIGYEKGSFLQMSYTCIETTSISLRNSSSIIADTLTHQVLATDDIKVSAPILRLRHFDCRSPNEGSQCLVVPDHECSSTTHHSDQKFQASLLLVKKFKAVDTSDHRLMWIGLGGELRFELEDLPTHSRRAGGDYILARTYAGTYQHKGSSVTIFDRRYPAGPHFHVYPPCQDSGRPRILSYLLKDVREAHSESKEPEQFLKTLVKSCFRSHQRKQASQVDTGEQQLELATPAASMHPFLLQGGHRAGEFTEVESKSELPQIEDEKPSLRGINIPANHQSVFRDAHSIEIHLRQGYLLVGLDQPALFNTEYLPDESSKPQINSGDEQEHAEVDDFDSRNPFMARRSLRSPPVRVDQILPPPEQRPKGKGKVGARVPRDHHPSPNLTYRNPASNTYSDAQMNNRIALVTFISKRLDAKDYLMMGGGSIYDDYKYRRMPPLHIKTEPT